MATLKTALNAFQPLSWAVAPDGVLYCANGIDNAMRWDGRTTSLQDAGITSPATRCNVTGTTSGTIYGDYTIYVRFATDDDTYSNLSTATTIAITSGAPITRFNYTSIPTSSNSRVSKREVYRNTAGQNVTWYRDVLIGNNTATTSSSTRTDGDLVTCSPLRYVTKDGWPNAMRFVSPPSHMSVVVSYGDRMWYAVPIVYDEGSASVTSTAVTGSGTLFHANMANWVFRKSGRQWQRILSRSSSTSLLLAAATEVGLGTANYYAVTPDEDERNKIYFSEPAEPESVPEENSIIMQEDGDRVTGLMVQGSYLYILKQRHIYRLATAGDPRRDLNISLVAERGCPNQRCWCRVEGVAFLMDRGGAYLFRGTDTEPISGPIQDYWRGRINWDAAKYFQVVYAPDEEVVRFVVALDNSAWPRHALRYHVRLRQWGEEEYPFDLGAAGLAQVGGVDRVVVGAEASVSVLDEGVLDGCAYDATAYEDELNSAATQTLRGQVDSATTTTIHDSDADWDFSGWHVSPFTTGAPIYIIAADGTFQSNRVASLSTTQTTTIIVQNSFDPVPTAGDTYMIGGIDWQAKFGAFSYLDQEYSNVRRATVLFQPQTDAANLNLRFYHNHASTPDTIGAVPYDGNVGAHVDRDSANVEIDLTKATGRLTWNIDRGLEGGTPADRFVEVELQGVSGTERTKIYGVDVDGVQP